MSGKPATTCTITTRQSALGPHARAATKRESLRAVRWSSPPPWIAPSPSGAPRSSATGQAVGGHLLRPDHQNGGNNTDFAARGAPGRARRPPHTLRSHSHGSGGSASRITITSVVAGQPLSPRPHDDRMVSLRIVGPRQVHGCQEPYETGRDLPLRLAPPANPKAPRPVRGGADSAGPSAVMRMVRSQRSPPRKSSAAGAEAVCDAEPEGRGTPRPPRS